MAMKGAKPKSKPKADASKSKLSKGLAKAKASQSGSDTVRARISPKLKRQAEAIFTRVGTTSSEAIRMLYAQVVLRGGLPFEVAIPNEATLKAVEELRQGKGTRVDSMGDLYRDAGV